MALYHITGCQKRAIDVIFDVIDVEFGARSTFSIKFYRRVFDDGKRLLLAAFAHFLRPLLLRDHRRYRCGRVLIPPEEIRRAAVITDALEACITQGDDDAEAAQEAVIGDDDAEILRPNAAEISGTISAAAKLSFGKSTIFPSAFGRIDTGIRHHDPSFIVSNVCFVGTTSSLSSDDTPLSFRSAAALR